MPHLNIFKQHGRKGKTNQAHSKVNRRKDPCRQDEARRLWWWCSGQGKESRSERGQEGCLHPVCQVPHHAAISQIHADIGNYEDDEEEKAPESHVKAIQYDDPDPAPQSQAR